ncbi:MAG: hypothetical protein M0Q26_09255 [Chitinophagaceae bacterium]|nr:hypothetical protein [Chitinophagaceae bacterium]
MKKIILFTFFSFNINKGFSQSMLKEIEIEPYIRFDKYPQFTNRINNIAVYDLQIKGNSWGINGSYKIPLKDNWRIKIGAGYYRYSFSKITSMHRTFGEGHRRIIDYPTTLDIILGTDNYWYNTVNIMLGLEKQFALNKKIQIFTGINFNNHFTFSQYYHMPYDNTYIPQPSLQIKNDYKTYDKRYFGLSSEFHFVVLKKINKVAIGPSIITPVFDLWRQDDIFPTEISTTNRQKWFGGIGVGFVINYTLKK